MAHDGWPAGWPVGWLADGNASGTRTCAPKMRTLRQKVDVEPRGVAGGTNPEVYPNWINYRFRGFDCLVVRGSRFEGWGSRFGG